MINERKYRVLYKLATLTGTTTRSILKGKSPTAIVEAVSKLSPTSKKAFDQAAASTKAKGLHPWQLRMQELMKTSAVRKRRTPARFKRTWNIARGVDMQRQAKNNPGPGKKFVGAIQGHLKRIGVQPR